jgi:glycosyltransferase involved in cell wall biosynthesis
MNKILIVNATAIHYSGALSIFNQFINNIPEENGYMYYFFINSNYVKIAEKKNFVYIPIATANWLARIKWDIYGMQRWLDKNKISPNLIISFQNTTVKCRYDIPQLIYYHQPLPLSKYHWNFFKSDELTLFLYKKFYLYFVSKYINDKTHFVVQIPSIKRAFLERIKINERNVHILKPIIMLPDYDLDYPMTLDDNIHFIYPATPLVYKNHIRIIESLYLIKKENPSLLFKIRVHFTFDRSMADKLFKVIHKYGLVDNIIFDGLIPYHTLLISYKFMRALLFPSFIETFGLPLIEAAGVGTPIVVSDLPYSRDVIGEYEGALFVDYDDTRGWADAIIKFCENDQRFTPLTMKNENSWKLFFELINQLI